MINILVTGGAGFIGSNFVSHIIKKYKNYNVINLDSLTYAGNLNNTSEFISNQQYKFIKGDICDSKLLEKIFDKYKIKSVINFAAESHVDNSIKKPDLFMKTNVMGTYTLLNAAYKYWMTEPFSYREEFFDSRFMQISTDEVYGSLDDNGLFTEKSPYMPNSPYSASKASSDLIVRSYYKTFGMNTVITCCSNNYGPKQHDEKLIPTIIRKALKHQDIPIYGDGKNIRDWLYVNDHCEAIDLAFHKGKKGQTYNVGGNCELTNLEVVNNICFILNKLAPSSKNYLSFLKFVRDRPGHDKRYAIDSTKIQSQLGWKPITDYKTCLSSTVKWYIQRYEK